MPDSLPIPPHTARRLAEHGEAVVVMPCEPQPEHEWLMPLAYPYRPGDVVTLECGVCEGYGFGHVTDWPVCYETQCPYCAGVGHWAATVAAVDCKPVREVTEEEWEATGLRAMPVSIDPYAAGSYRVDAEMDWTETHAPRGPAYAWERAWVFLVTLRRESDG